MDSYGSVKWKNSTRIIFWGVILISFSGILSTIYDYVSYLTNFVQLASDLMSSLVNSFGDDNTPKIELDKFVSWGLSSKGLVVIGYIMYLWGLTKFAQIQELDSTAHQIRKVRTATILLVIVFLLDIVFGVLSIIPFTKWFFSLLVWLMTLGCFYKMKHAFAELMEAEDFNERARRGARNLRYGAACEIRLRWLPLMTSLLILLILGMAFLILSSQQSLENMGNLMKMVGFMIVLILVIAGIMAICAMFCAFWWPIMGWYRIMTGGPAEEAPEQLRQDDSGDAPTSMLPQEEIAQDVQIEGEGESTNWVEENKKWLFPVGGVAVLGLLAWGAVSISGLGKKNNLLPIVKPQWETFVMVTIPNAPLYKEADENSPRLMYAMENLESDIADFQFRWSDQGKKRGYTLSDYSLQPNEVLPVLEEKEDWLKVHVEAPYGGQTAAYVRKAWCREVTPSPITDEVLLRIAKGSWRCDNVVKSGKWKGLCFTTTNSEMEEESLQMGIIDENCLLFPEQSTVWCTQSMDGSTGFEKVEESGAAPYYRLTYSQEQRYSIDGEDKFVFNTQLLTEEEMENIYNSIKHDAPAYVTASYYFPEVDADRLFSFTYSNASAAPVITEDDRVQEGVRNYTIEDVDDQTRLMAELDEEKVFAGVENDIVEILHEEDFDGDGYNEVLISESCSGSGCIPEAYVVYYDKDAKEFKHTNSCESNVGPAIEKQDGKTVIVQKEGLKTIKYVYEDHALKLVGKDIVHVGKILKTFTRAALFPEDSDGDETTVEADIDGDGTSEILVFGHDTSHACDNGKAMFLDRIQWADGRIINDYFGLFSSPSFAILESSTNGMHDVLLNDAHLFRWNGSKYEEYQWDGSQFIKLPTY